MDANIIIIMRVILFLVFIPLLGEIVSADFTIAVLPDTQNYVEKYPEIFKTQTQWIVDNTEKESIVFVIHEGDIVNQQINHTQWETANESMSILDGKVPYILAVGNHDMGSTEGDAEDRNTSIYNTYFPYTRFEKEEWYGEHRGRDNNNYYVTFSADGMDFLILSLEFGPDHNMLNWANQVVFNHRDRRVIVVTHAYLSHDGSFLDRTDRLNPHLYGIEKLGIVAYKINGTRYNFNKNVDDYHYVLNSSDEYYLNYSAPNDGEEIWKKFVSRHPNIFLVLSGHDLSDGNDLLTSEGIDGNRVHQMVANYQFLPNGGDGWMRLLKFKPGDNKINVRTYSPWLKNNNFYEYSKNYDYWYVGYEKGIYKGQDANIPIVDPATGEPIKYYLKDEHDFDLEYEMLSNSQASITGNVIESGEEKKTGKSLTWLWILGGVYILVIIIYFLKKRK